MYVNPAFSKGKAGTHTYGVDAFRSIQEGVNAVDNGGTVHVARGMYKEVLTIKKSLSLIGEETPVSKDYPISLPVVDAGKNSSFAVITVNGEKHPVEVTIRDLELRNGNTGINVLQNAAMTIDKNIIKGYYKNGITFGPVKLPGYGGITGKITNNKIFGSGPTDKIAQNGIQISEDNTAVIYNNLIANHVYTAQGETWAIGAMVYRTNGVIIRDNLFTKNQAGINIKQGSNHILSTNTINGDTNTQAGIMISTYNDPAFKASGNIVDKNTITGGYVGIWTSYNSGNTFTGNIISGTSGNGIYSFESYDNVISNNKIIKTQASTKKGWGITLDQSSPHTQQEGTRTSITNNELISEGTSTLNDGISVYANDSVQLADNTLSSTSVLFAEKITKPAGIVLGTSTEAVRRDLSRGDSGEEVTLVQEALARNGYKIRRTGYFGIATENAVLDFQKNHDLKPTGIVDSTTRSALFNTEN